jgi:hypothetical protein
VAAALKRQGAKKPRSVADPLTPPGRGGLIARIARYRLGEKGVRNNGLGLLGSLAFEGRHKPPHGMALFRARA